jgi:hypothetical protein
MRRCMRRRVSDSQRRIRASTAGVLADRWTPTRPSGPSGRCAGRDASSGAAVCCSTAAGYEELVRCMAAPGVAWPPKDWAATWERVRAERPTRWPGSAISRTCRPRRRAERRCRPRAVSRRQNRSKKRTSVRHHRRTEVGSWRPGETPRSPHLQSSRRCQREEMPGWGAPDAVAASIPGRVATRPCSRPRPSPATVGGSGSGWTHAAVPLPRRSLRHVKATGTTDWPCGGEG